MLILTAWLVIMGAGGLCVPRQPRTAGVLFLAAGVFMLAVWTAGTVGNARIEICVNRLKDLGLNKGLENLPALRQKLVIGLSP